LVRRQIYIEEDGVRHEGIGRGRGVREEASAVKKTTGKQQRAVRRRHESGKRLRWGGGVSSREEALSEE